MAAMKIALDRIEKQSLFDLLTMYGHIVEYMKILEMAGRGESPLYNKYQKACSDIESEMTRRDELSRRKGLVLLSGSFGYGYKAIGPFRDSGECLKLAEQLETQYEMMWMEDPNKYVGYVDQKATNESISPEA